MTKIKDASLYVLKKVVENVVAQRKKLNNVCRDYLRMGINVMKEKY